LIVGRHPAHEELRGGLQEMHHPPLFAGISVWAYSAMAGDRLADVTVTAMRKAFSGRGGPVVVDVGWDVQADEVPASVPTAVSHRANRAGAAAPETVAEIAAMLGDAGRPVVFAGTGLRWSKIDPPLAEFAETARVPVFLNSLARGALRWDHPHLGNRSRSWALGQADFVLALGVDWDFRTRFGGVLHPEAGLVHVDADPGRIGVNRSVDVGVCADPGAVLAQLLDAAHRYGKTSDPPWVEEVAGEEARRAAAAEEAASSAGSPVHPERFAKAVAEFFGDDTVVAADGGDIVSTTAKWLRTSRPGHLLDPGPFGALGVGAPFALAAKAAAPDTRVGIVFGDGAFGFNGFEYDSLVRHGLPVVGVVGNDGAWNNVRAIQRMLFPDRPVAADLGVRPYHEVVAALGGYGEFVDDPADLPPALHRAEESGLPSLVNVHIAEQFRPSSAYGF
jgi:acetolactate synthase-1/2/3 large subunit